MINFEFIWDSIPTSFAAGYALHCKLFLVWSELKAHGTTFRGCF